MDKRVTYLAKMDSMIEDIKAMGNAAMEEGEFTYEEKARIVSLTESVLNWMKNIRTKVDQKWPAPEEPEV